ncbi:nmrA-family protein [Sistotremastrum suecicum HHB10207 ss-3]|uniref:NmrA-family protein n=1 Tax=Sistotremastrum suecicum HHB10207 ss-3 TaxID=1314776 RepID=A0A166E1N5_9AGAM|nr:nmrA-family protein [Sistotremastrum suecicum HHB10207 ss-3]
MASKKLILVIGATGAQGRAVIDSLLAPAADGTPSPYAVRALTRDAQGKSAKEIAALPDAETFQGSFTDFNAVRKALEGCYGAFVNTDGFVESAETELQSGVRIFELAKEVGTIKHFVWSNLDYGYKKSGYNPKHKCDHYDGKGRVLEFMKAQPSHTDGMVWSSLTTGPYMEMLRIMMFGPVARDEKDGSFIFASPIGSGFVPMIALKDLGYFSRFMFDHREGYSGKDLEVASELVYWPKLVETFTRVTDQPARFVDVPLELWFDLVRDADRPVASKYANTDAAALHTSWRQNFSGWWTNFREGLLTRDMEYLKSIHPGLRSIEDWMRENKYDGTWKPFLKDPETGNSVGFNPKGAKEIISKVENLSRL